MSFLFPLYLLGALAIGLPILLHLRRRPPKDHVPFSSHMFLEKTPERLTRRTRIERWLLLALRCLALILLALAFGRPFFQSDSLDITPSEGVRAVVLVDQSASMRRADLWQKAVDAAVDKVGQFGAGDEVALATVSGDFELLASFATWERLSPSARKDAARKLLGEQATWESTDLGNAVTEASELMEDIDSDQARVFAKKEIILISDYQHGAERDSLNRYAWPETVAVRPLQISLDSDVGNLAINLVAASNSSDDRRVRLSNDRESTNEEFSIQWEGADSEEAVSGKLPPGASRVMTVPSRTGLQGEDAVLRIEGDSHPFDNRVFVARSQPRLVEILFLTEKPADQKAGSPLFYLTRAMQPTTTIDPTVVVSTYADTSALKTSQVVIVQGNLTETLAEKLATFAEQGGLVIAIPDAESANGLEALTGLENLAITEANVSDYAMLSKLDFEHPILTPFARSGLRDFTRIHTWKHRSLTLPADAENVRQLASFDSGDPAWVEVKRGDGVILMMMSGWQPRESQLALSSKFVPLIYSILGRAGYSAVEGKPLLVGDAIPLHSAKAVRLPDGNEVNVTADQGGFAETNAPGFYTVIVADGSERVHAVNLAPGESRVAPVDPLVMLGDLGVKMITDELEAAATAEEAALTEKEKQRLEAAEKEENQKLWKWLALAVLIVLVIETWIAGRRRMSAEAAPAT